MMTTLRRKAQEKKYGVKERETKQQRVGKGYVTPAEDKGDGLTGLHMNSVPNWKRIRDVKNAGQGRAEVAIDAQTKCLHPAVLLL